MQQLIAIVRHDYDSAHASLDQARRTAQCRSLERLRRLTDTEQFRLLIVSDELDEASRFARRIRMTPKTAYERDANNLSRACAGQPQHCFGFGYGWRPASCSRPGTP